MLALGRAFVRTVRHFWPGLNQALSALPDSRCQPMVEYAAPFLCWWGLLLFVLKLSSRRQLDFQLRDLDGCVLENINRLAQSNQTSLPVNKPLSHFLGHLGPQPLAQLRTDCVRQLMRNKVLDSIRLEGSFVVAVDGTGFLCFKEQHCPHCLVHEHDSVTSYLHPVLEAKLVDTRGLALSIGSEFIQNPKKRQSLTDYQRLKQDCELKAFERLAVQLKKQFPQTRLCLASDALYACGPVFSICRQKDWSFVLTFKEGRTPALWRDFQDLLKLSPGSRLVVHCPDKTRQTFRWVNDLEHIDENGLTHHVNALLCQEEGPNEKRTFAWLTSFKLSRHNVCAIATQGGRVRCKIENQGFNIQKNSGLNLEHAYSTDPEVMKAFYYLLQIAHLFLQMFEMGSLLRDLARQHESTPLKLFGSLKNLGQRLLECFRYFALGAETFLPAKIQIRLCDST